VMSLGLRQFGTPIAVLLGVGWAGYNRYKWMPG